MKKVETNQSITRASARTFAEKVEALKALAPAEEFKYFPMSSETAWQASPTEGLFRPDGKFFRALTVMGKWLQPIFCQESQVYDREACFRCTGAVQMPLRKVEDRYEFGVTAKAGPGSFGETTFTFPRRSWSNPAAFPQHDKLFYERLLRSDVARMTGRAMVQIAYNPHHQDLVWFDAETEAALLAQHELMDDAMSLMLINRFLQDPSLYVID